MAIIYTYTLVTPQPLDSVVITDASDNNYTKTSYIGDAVAASIAPGANIYFTFGGGITTINAADYDLGGTWINDLEYNIELTEDNNGIWLGEVESDVYKFSIKNHFRTSLQKLSLLNQVSFFVIELL